MRPKYVVLTVIYAPPGTQSAKGASSVEYASGSSAGTNTSSSKTFKTTISSSFDGSGGVLGTGGGVGLDFSYSRSSEDTQSVDVKKSESTTLQVTGPSKEGIDHDHDLIYLWLNPTISLSLSSSSASWRFTGTDVAQIQYVYVGWLKNSETMPQGVAQILAKLGFTSQDYKDIIQRDPLANDLSKISQIERYQPLNFTFPYEPPYSGGDPVPLTSYSISTVTRRLSENQ